MSSQFNKGSQIITWDFKNPAKARYFDRLNRNVIKPGVYSGLTINFAGHTVSLSSGTAVLNCSFEALDFLQIKVDFETSYSFSEQIYPSMTESKEIIYLEYQYAEVTENFVDIKHMSSTQYFLSPVENSIIVGELLFDTFNNIIGIDYSNKTWGMVNADIDHGFPDTTYYFNTITQTKKWKTTGVLLPSGTKELQYVSFNESIGRILTTSPTNTTPIENKMSIGSTEESISPSTGAMVLAGGLGVAKNVIVGQDVAVSGRVDVKTEASVGGSVSVGVDASISRNVIVRGNVSVSGNIASAGSISTLSSASVGDRLSAGSFDGRVPLGGIVAIVGTRTAINNGGSPIIPSNIPSSGILSSDGFQRCDGVAVGSGSTLTGFLPKIDDDRFIQGSTNLGILSSSNGVNLGNNTVSLLETNLPSHSHSGSTGGFSSDHSHGYADRFGSESDNLGTNHPNDFRIDKGYYGVGMGATDYNNNMYYATNALTGGVSSNHTHSFTTGSGNGNASAFDIRPKYISAIYLMRVR